MTDINELRQSLGAVQPEEVAELLDRLEAAEKEAAYIKEVEFPRKALAVTVGWKTKCARLEQERDALLAKVEAMKGYPPYVAIGKILTEVMDIATANGADSRSMPDEYVEVAAWLCGVPGAQPAPSLPDTHNDMVVGLDYQGAMSCARQRAKKEAGLIYPEGDARKEEKERELASEYYRQYTTPNPGAKP